MMAISLLPYAFLKTAFIGRPKYLIYQY